MKALLILVMLLISSLVSLFAQTNESLRRPISPQQPMWIVHIDTWNNADPQKIIDLIPKDIRPFVVMNISLSVSHDEETYRFSRAEYGYETAKSWLRTCAQNRMWAMIQPASGGYSHFPDGDMSVYEEFFKTYPNFLGFNYAEQFWGFDEDHPLSAGWSERMSHLASLLELSNKYGGYLGVSICWNKWGPGLNPIGMLKRNSEFAEACSQYTENYILLDKHTQVAYLHDRESMSLGAYLSGYSGQYGIRYDDTGWTDGNENHQENFTMATYSAPFLEHTMLTGLTVYDGPELIWTECFKEVDPIQTSEGYSSRHWETFPQFDNVSVDLFRKVLDGTVRIPSREEVIDRTKYALIHDVNSGSDDEKYSSPDDLYEGLYLMDNDGSHEENFSFFKKTGRYPTIPIVYDLNDDIADTFEEKIYISDYSNRWPTIDSKVEEFNNKFPKEYTGDIYAGRHENGWVTYNPYKTGQTASGSIPFKYNTCEKMELTYSRYTAGVVKEYSDHVTFYLNNFDNELNADLKTNIIKIYGSSSEPNFVVNDRGNYLKSKVEKNWENGVFTLTIQHNGPIDLKIECSGNETDPLTEYQTANITVPQSPPTYKGDYQYEAETFDYKNITDIVEIGSNGDIRNYTGQGYLQFGTNENASIRDRVTVLNDGTYNLKTKYTVTGADVNSIDLYINDEKVATPLFTKTDEISNWSVNSQEVELSKGENVIELKASTSLSGSIYFDNIIIEKENKEGIWMEAECGNAGSSWENISDTNASNGKFLSFKPENDISQSGIDDPESQISFSLNIDESNTYALWGRIKQISTNEDALWFKMNNDSWTAWDTKTADEDWTWVKLNTQTLSAGEHLLSIASSYDGTQLDKLFITKSENIPSKKGGPAMNCSVDNQTPIAFCGSDITLIDYDEDGSVSVPLTSNGSIDPDGSIVSYSWSSDGQELSTQANPTLELPVGVHDIKLTVEDNEGAIDTDMLTIKIFEGSYEKNTIWLEAECGEVGDNWNKIDNNAASNGSYITVKSGNESMDQAPDTNEGLVKMPFNTVSADTFTVYARVNCPSPDEDSFWVKMNNESFNVFNGLGTDGWEWVELGTYSLSEGEQNLTIGYREDGALLDKIFITKYSEEPMGKGDDAKNCETDRDTSSDKEISSKKNNLYCYPNPFIRSTLIKYHLKKPGQVLLTVYDSKGQQIDQIVRHNQVPGEHNFRWKPSGLPGGVFFFRIQTEEYSETRKLIYQK